MQVNKVYRKLSSSPLGIQVCNKPSLYEAVAPPPPPHTHTHMWHLNLLTSTELDLWTCAYDSFCTNISYFLDWSRVRLLNKPFWPCLIHHKRMYLCLLAPRQWVVSAAHCFSTIPPQTRRKTVKVVLGEFDTQNREGQEVFIDVGKVIKHKKYNSNTLDYDIALIKLKTPLKEYNRYIKPVCLPGEYLTSTNLFWQIEKVCIALINHTIKIY